MTDSDNNTYQADTHGTRLSAAAVYSAIRHDGEDELERRPWSLWWSGLAAGVAISISVLAEGFLHSKLPSASWVSLVESFGYALGFVVVILGRMQLFTENTITAVLPVLSLRTFRALGLMLRLWLIVFVANMVGTFLAAMFIHYGLATPEQLHAMVTISTEAMSKSWLDMFLQAIPAGFLVAVIVWMLPNGRGAELWLILFTAYLMGLGGFSHIIVGSVEAFLLFFSGEMGLITISYHFILPVLLGNIIGGTLLFSLLAYGQVQEKVG